MKYNCINGWTKRKMINHVKKEFKGYSYDKSKNLCVYRGPKGKKCAVGMFIPDELYNSDMECVGLNIVLQYWPILKTTLPLHSQDLTNFQICHDSFNERDESKLLPILIAWIKDNVN